MLSKQKKMQTNVFLKVFIMLGKPANKFNRNCAPNQFKH